MKEEVKEEGTQTPPPASPPGAAPAPSAPPPKTPANEMDRPFYHPPAKGVKPKLGKNLLACSLYALLVLAVFAALIAVAVAKSGMIAVPFASQLYEGPQPTRVVQVDARNPVELLEVIQEAITPAEGTTERTPHVVSYSEGDLTIAARGALADAEKRGEADTSRTQVVIRPDAVQLTGRFKVKGVMLDVQLEGVPTANDGALYIQITSARFGDFPVAPPLAKLAVDTALGRDSSRWEVKIGDHEIRDVKLGDGKVELVLY